MKIIYKKYSSEEIIPVNKYLKNKKLKKYFNPETAASIATTGELLDGRVLPEETPFYFSYGKVAFNIVSVANDCLDEQNNYQNELFVNKSYNNVSPLTQLKFLQNMPLSFVSIENNLKGDNAVVYVSAQSLIDCVKYSPYEDEILIGASKLYFDRSVEVGFALVTRDEILAWDFNEDNLTAVDMFKQLYREHINE